MHICQAFLASFEFEMVSNGGPVQDFARGLGDDDDPGHFYWAIQYTM
jgi:hypothetical protein